jgi:hypothetical protein
MFLSDQRMLTISISAARARLANQVYDGRLSGASETAYQDGLEHLLWVGPAGNVPGLSPLVRVQFADPVDRTDSVTMGMRWEAIGVTGGLFPALDANITLAAEGDHNTRMTLTGVYRPPFGPLGAGLDRVILHKVATATIDSLLTRMGGALEGTTPAPGDASAPKSWETGPETAT